MSGGRTPSPSPLAGRSQFAGQVGNALKAFGRNKRTLLYPWIGYPRTKRAHLLCVLTPELYIV